VTAPKARKVLYSPGYGAGWVSWSSSEPVERQRFMLEHPALIAAVESPKPATVTAEKLQAAIDDHTRSMWGEEEWAKGQGMRLHGLFRDVVPEHLRDAMMAFVSEWHERWPSESLPYLGGLRQLEVYEVPAGKRIRIDEYDGSESITVEGDCEGWL
jgi:hypothetical protein